MPHPNNFVQNFYVPSYSGVDAFKNFFKDCSTYDSQETKYPDLFRSFVSSIIMVVLDFVNDVTLLKQVWRNTYSGLFTMHRVKGQSVHYGELFGVSCPLWKYNYGHAQRYVS